VQEKEDEVKYLFISMVLLFALCGSLFCQEWPNEEFVDNLYQWWVIHSYEAGTGNIIDPGYVEHSTYFGGSVHMVVSGAPSVIGLMNFAEIDLNIGDQIEMLVEHTGLINIGGISLRVGGGPEGEVENCPDAAGLYLVTRTLTKSWPAGTPVWVHFVVWPGTEEAWVDYIRLAETSVNEKDDEKNSVSETVLAIEPNPSVCETAISFTLDVCETVSIDIYDNTGRKVRNLLSSTLREGTHELYWDGKDDEGSDVADGIYICRFSAGKQTDAKKIVLIK
jgi:hypothetical protein